MRKTHNKLHGRISRLRPKHRPKFPASNIVDGIFRGTKTWMHVKSHHREILAGIAVALFLETSIASYALVSRITYHEKFVVPPPISLPIASTKPVTTSPSSTAPSSTPTAKTPAKATTKSPTSSQSTESSGGAASSPTNSNISGVPAGITPGAVFENDFNAMTITQRAAVIAEMKADGVSWLRLDVSNIFLYYNFIQDATAAGIHVDAILQDWNMPATPAAMGSFATQAVARLKPLGVETYEVLNEPNGCEDSMSASAYTAILQSTYAAIKAADSNAFVLTGGLCPNSGSNEPYNYLAAMYAAGAKGYFDGFNMHPYSYPDTPEQPDVWNPWHYLSELHDIMADNGDGDKQIWLTEFGCPTGTEGGQTVSCTDATLAQQITEAFSLARAQTYIGPMFIFNWQDDTDGDFGLYNGAGGPKADSLAAFIAAANS